MTDRGKLFMSSFWQDLFYVLGNKLKLSFFYHQQIDGQIKIVNQTLEQYLQCYCREEQTKWKEFIPWVESHHASINMTTFEVVYGRPPSMLATYKNWMTQNKKVVDQK